MAVRLQVGQLVHIRDLGSEPGLGVILRLRLYPYETAQIDYSFFASTPHESRVRNGTRGVLTPKHCHLTEEAKVQSIELDAEWLRNAGIDILSPVEQLALADDPKAEALGLLVGAWHEA